MFGKKGDAITSPEIIRVFGELCGIWYWTEWDEIRPTLKDSNLSSLDLVNKLYYVEASPGLHKMQRMSLLKGSTDNDVIIIEGDKDEPPLETITRSDGVKVSWYDGIEVVPDMVIQCSTQL
ncbi:hypothetical protein HPULCUR_000983 [Helicostylum pulchrum]|uniref:Protein arginine methyltransferase NDUFAF7 n=1 Tax=Helicostylum pulchrum TaxID=562976 RepID=A0ABP9XNH8_9FUNG